MPLTIFLDSGPLGLITNPKAPPPTIEILTWVAGLRKAGSRFIVPAIADYEVRRELERAGKLNGLRSLDLWNSLEPDRYLVLSDSALRLAAKLWAGARNAGFSTADPKELDSDVIIAAQAIDFGVPRSEFIVATVNVGHLSRFAPAAEWRSIQA